MSIKTIVLSTFNIMGQQKEGDENSKNKAESMNIKFKSHTMIEKVCHENNLLAIILKSSSTGDGVFFFTPPEFSQQLGLLCHRKGKVIDPHIHNVVKREVHYTQEVLFIRKGTLRVDFYDEQQNFLFERVLQDGDVILLSSGGHGFEALSDVDIVEVKQGPYAGELDKVRFPSSRPNINPSCE